MGGEANTPLKTKPNGKANSNFTTQALTDNSTISAKSDKKAPLTKPQVERRPCFAVYDDETGYGPSGLYWHGVKGSGENIEAVDYRVSTPIHVEAMTASPLKFGRRTDYGLLLRFQNSHWEWCEWVMPMHLLKGSGEELRGILLDMGVRIYPQYKRLFNDYLFHQYPKKKLLAATRTGWCNDGKSFVLPHKVMGKDNVRFQSEYLTDECFSVGGSLEGWQREIGRRCRGNAMLQLVISVSLAGPLLERLKHDNCGIHLFHDSSNGKTTALRAAASVFGHGKNFLRTWIATANGLEAAATELNDTTLMLDEVSAANAYEIGSVIYSLGNGLGKSRANRSGMARSLQRWRITLLSSGERSLAATVAEVGKRTKAGQEVRLLNIPCQRNYGVFDMLHDANGKAMSEAIEKHSQAHYGHVGMAFIEKLLADRNDLAKEYESYKALPQFAYTESLHGRAAGHFALFALAGELGIEYGLLPWDRDDAVNAAATGYELWREFHGSGNTEDAQILQAVEDFLAKHGDSRFSSHDDSDTGVPNRAGWWKWIDGQGRTYMFTSTGLKEATTGFDFKRALDALEKSEWLVERGAKQRSKQTKVLGKKEDLYYIRVPDSTE
jgi:putative DNA primase/helicase